LDLRNELVDLIRGFLSCGYPLKLSVDHIGFRQEGSPEVRLRLVVLVRRDGSAMGIRSIRTVQIGRKFGEATDRARGPISARGRVQISIILDDADDIQQIVI